MGAVAVTAKGEDDVDYFLRFFGRRGIEDPGTGIAQCFLAPYWSKILDKSKMSVSQLSERGSEFTVEVVKSGVRVTGSATMLIKGTLTI